MSHVLAKSGPSRSALPPRGTSSIFFNAKQPPDDQQRYSVTDKTEVKVVATAEERGQILPPTSVTMAASF